MLQIQKYVALLKEMYFIGRHEGFMVSTPNDSIHGGDSKVFESDLLSNEHYVLFWHYVNQNMTVGEFLKAASCMELANEVVDDLIIRTAQGGRSLKLQEVVCGPNPLQMKSLISLLLSERTKRSEGGKIDLSLIGEAETKEISALAKRVHKRELHFLNPDGTENEWLKEAVFLHAHFLRKLPAAYSNWKPSEVKPPLRYRFKGLVSAVKGFILAEPDLMPIKA